MSGNTKANMVDRYRRWVDVVARLRRPTDISVAMRDGLRQTAGGTLRKALKESWRKYEESPDDSVSRIH